MEKTMKTLKTLASAAVLAFTMGAGVALADTSTETRSVAVRTESVDFANPQDIDSLQRSIVRAANRVCGVDGRLSARQVALRNACARRATDQAVEMAGIAPLRVLHASLTQEDRYRSWRSAPDANVMQMVADAAETMPGRGSSAGTTDAPKKRK
jgi:UrcA family protein